MKVYIYSRSIMERHIKKGLPSNTAIVSFADTEEDFIEFPEGTNVLKIAFYDVRPHTVMREHWDSVLPEAKQIAEFVDKNIKEGKDIICQCEYGISRSAGLAAAIMQKYCKKGVNVFADYRFIPNQFVYNLVFKELEKLHK